VNVEHVDVVGPLERGEADRRILQRRDQRELAGQTLAECFLILGDTGPCLLLRFAIIVAGQVHDGRSKDRRQDGNIRRQQRP
jgi:hypothetical protein